MAKEKEIHTFHNKNKSYYIKYLTWPTPPRYIETVPKSKGN
jgi:hypothetical protein